MKLYERREYKMIVYSLTNILYPLALGEREY